MIELRAPLVGWGALFLSAFVAALLPSVWQLGYAAATIAILGLPHGAADVALVLPTRRVTFLVTYLTAIVLVVLAWQISPSLALSAFLLLSLVHFATDGQSGSDRVRRWAMAFMLIAGPAIFHRHDIVFLFEAVDVEGIFATTLAEVLHVVGIVALAIIFIVRAIRKAQSLPKVVEILAIVSLTISPPLIGFAVGFIALHAYDQTIARQKRLELSGLTTYLIKTLPVLVGAAIVLFAIILYAPPSTAGVRTLFVAISALAVPHMLVAPFWLRPSRTPHSIRIAQAA